MFSQHKEDPLTHTPPRLLEDFQLKLPESLFDYYSAPIVFEDDEGLTHGMDKLPLDWQGLPMFVDRAQVLGTHLLKNVVEEEQREFEAQAARTTLVCGQQEQGPPAPNAAGGGRDKL
jgi:hypothetical protein